MDAPARVAKQTFLQPTNQPANPKNEDIAKLGLKLPSEPQPNHVQAPSTCPPHCHTSRLRRCIKLPSVPPSHGGSSMVRCGNTLRTTRHPEGMNRFASTVAGATTKPSPPTLTPANASLMPSPEPPFKSTERHRRPVAPNPPAASGACKRETDGGMYVFHQTTPPPACAWRNHAIFFRVLCEFNRCLQGIEIHKWDGFFTSSFATCMLSTAQGTRDEGRETRDKRQETRDKSVARIAQSTEVGPLHLFWVHFCGDNDDLPVVLYSATEPPL
jgi:hypothetical protein